MEKDYTDPKIQEKVLYELICADARGAINMLTRMIEEIEKGHKIKSKVEANLACNQMKNIATYFDILGDMETAEKQKRKIGFTD